jgi:nicotinate phosphoribosyltransferase
LTDTIGVDAFIKDFDMYFAKLYDGVRHDSGDPIKFGKKIIKMYQSFNIDPKTKTIIFSDNLTFSKAIKLYDYFKDHINIRFGIGTNLTNDTGGIFDPINIVIKLVTVNGKPVAKISDSEGKTICENKAFVNKLKKLFNMI